MRFKLILALIVICFFTTIGWNVYDSHREITFASDLARSGSAIEQRFVMAQGNFNGLTTQVALKGGMVPSTWIVESETGEKMLQTPWGGAITISAINNGSDFIIKSDGLSAGLCQSLADAQKIKTWKKGICENESVTLYF